MLQRETLAEPPADRSSSLIQCTSDLVDRESQPLDGQSLLPLLKGEVKGFPQRPLFWHFPAYLEGKAEWARDPRFRTRPGGAVRAGDFKLIEYFEDGALELYNLTDDIAEQNNLAKTMPEKATELHKLMLAWRKAVNAPVPTELNPDYNP